MTVAGAAPILAVDVMASLRRTELGADRRSAIAAAVAFLQQGF